MNNQTPLKRSFGLAELLVVTLALILPFFLSMAFQEVAAYDCSQEPTPKFCCNGIFYLDAAVCSRRGLCDITTTPSHCDCTIPGWEGNNCQYEARCGSSACGALCNGHGKCENNACLCYAGYGGVCCQTQISDSPALKPAAVDFGFVTVGSASQSQTATLTTPGNMTVNTIALSGDSAADFSLGGTCSGEASLSSGGSCGIVVTFTPAAAGSRSATLTVTGSLPALGGEPSSWNPTITDPVSVTFTSALTGTGVISADSIVVDPATPTTLYAGLNGAGVYKSIDSGGNWTAAATQPTNRRVKALAIKPGDSTKLYAGTHGGGVYKNTNSGVDWSVCANTNLANLNVVSLTIDANGRLYAGTEAGVFVSTDGCETWATMNTGLPN